MGQQREQNEDKGRRKRLWTKQKGNSMFHSQLRAPLKISVRRDQELVPKDTGKSNQNIKCGFVSTSREQHRFVLEDSFGASRLHFVAKSQGNGVRL